jgi:hypothetical protein
MMLTPSQEVRDSPVGTLLPRYRRVLSFSDVLDESVRLFRQHWINFTLISAIALLPPGFLLIWVSAAGFLGRTTTLAALETGRFQDPADFAQLGGVIFVSTLISVLFGLLWTGATVTAADAYLRGEEPSPLRVYGVALRRLLAVLFATVLYGLALIAVSIGAIVLSIVTLLGVAGIVPLVALIVWWLRPGARKGWVKWLIIVTAPYGLLIYYGFRWAMYAAAAVLEGYGPIGALRRSGQLTHNYWFRVASVLFVAGLIVAVLRSVLLAAVDIPLAIGSASRGEIGLGPAESAISTGVSVVLQILFASVGSIVYTLLFVDLRNRREGTDMAERLTQLEASAITPGG